MHTAFIQVALSLFVYYACFLLVTTFLASVPFPDEVAQLITMVKVLTRALDDNCQLTTLQDRL